MLEQQIDQCVQALMPELSGISDAIFDRPEEGLKEYFALAQLTDWLEARGYQVERGVAGVETAFRAVWRNGTGGPNIGLLCEYDALPGLGHACGHHMHAGSVRKYALHTDNLWNAGGRKRQRQEHDDPERVFLCRAGCSVDDARWIPDASRCKIHGKHEV